MTSRPLARRAHPLRRALPAAVALAALTSAGCRSGSILTFNPISDAMTAETLMGCVAEAATEAGLPVIERRTATEEPTLWARSASMAEPAPRDGRRVDMLTVSFKKLGRGLRVVAQTFDLRPGARTDARSTSAPAAFVPMATRREPETNGTLWSATSPSMRVAEARDAVLARCGTLGP